MQKTYSKRRVSKAGKELACSETSQDKQTFDEALEVLSYWRSCHEVALENALRLLKTTTLKKDKDAFFSKRLKRHPSIVNKLKRFPEMELKNMQDIGGCRAIVSSPKRVIQIAREFKKMPEFKNNNGKTRFKNYIEQPKEDGYRGYHMIGKFDDGCDGTKSIELQIRTKLQHDWATTLEIVDLFTGQALKSNQGDDSWKSFFANTSKQFSIMEESGHFHNLNRAEKYEEYGRQLLANVGNKGSRIASCLQVKAHARKLKVENLLSAYANSLQVTDEWLTDRQDAADGYVLIDVDTTLHRVDGVFFASEDFASARQLYLERERATASEESIVALVSSSAVGGVREAYPNYFADSTAFLEHLSLIMKALILSIDRMIFISTVNSYVS